MPKSCSCTSQLRLKLVSLLHRDRTSLSRFPVCYSHHLFFCTWMNCSHSVHFLCLAFRVFNGYLCWGFTDLHSCMCEVKYWQRYHDWSLTCGAASPMACFTQQLKDQEGAMDSFQNGEERAGFLGYSPAQGLLCWKPSLRGIPRDLEEKDAFKSNLQDQLLSQKILYLTKCTESQIQTSVLVTVPIEEIAVFS